MSWLPRNKRHVCQEELPTHGWGGPGGSSAIVGDRYRCEGRDLIDGVHVLCEVIWEVAAVGVDDKKLSWRRWGSGS